MDIFKNRAPFKRNDTGDHGTTTKEYGVNSDEKELPSYDNEGVERRASVASYNISGIHDETHRKLKPRHIQLIGMRNTASLSALGKPR